MSTITAAATAPVTIRLATAGDAGAVARLARLDQRPVPAGDLVLAEVDGELRAALGVLSREVLADPFAPTRDLVALLDARAAILRRETVRPAVRIGARLRLWSDLLWRAQQVHPSV